LQSQLLHNNNNNPADGPTKFPYINID